MDKLRDTKLTKPFLQKVVAVGKTEYRHINSIYKLYRKWKEKGAIQNRAGRPSLSLLELDQIAKDSIASCSSDSNCFRLKDMKEAFASRKKEEAKKMASIPTASMFQYQTTLPRHALLRWP